SRRSRSRSHQPRKRLEAPYTAVSLARGERVARPWPVPAEAPLGGSAWDAGHRGESNQSQRPARENVAVRAHFAAPPREDRSALSVPPARIVSRRGGTGVDPLAREKSGAVWQTWGGGDRRPRDSSARCRGA